LSIQKRSVPTIQDVAREAGVSPSTVSNVLNRRWKQTSKETRERILDVARRLNYQPNAMAAALRRRSSRTIGVVVTNILNPFYTAMVRSIQDQARQAGYTTILGNTDDDPEQERDILNTLRAKQVDGMLIVTTGGAHETIKHVSQTGVPIVMVDRADPALNVDSIFSDNTAGAENAARYLIELGHRRIALVSGLTTGVPTRANRLQGYLKALESAGVPAPLEYREILQTSIENGRAAAGRLLSLPSPPTAILGTNNFLSLGVIQEVHLRGLKLPDNLSFIMFDDPEWAGLHTPGITTVDQPVEEIGARAFQMLEGRMKQRRPPGSPQQVVFAAKLIVRGSCGPPPR
jgi:LacI family transcriptional regulator